MIGVFVGIGLVVVIVFVEVGVNVVLFYVRSKYIEKIVFDLVVWMGVKVKVY